MFEPGDRVYAPAGNRTHIVGTRLATQIALPTMQPVDGPVRLTVCGCAVDDQWYSDTHNALRPCRVCEGTTP